MIYEQIRMVESIDDDKRWNVLLCVAQLPEDPIYIIEQITIVRLSG